MNLKETREALNRVEPFVLRTRTEPIELWRDEHGAHANIPQQLVYHSPDGFEWGYGGSGPADLALNILALFVPPYWAWRMHQDFKWHQLAPLSREGPHTIEAEVVWKWIDARRELFEYTIEPE